MSSAASEGVMEGRRRAVGAFRGSAVKIPSISFQIWRAEALRPTAVRAAVRSEYLHHDCCY